LRNSGGCGAGIQTPSRDGPTTSAQVSGEAGDAQPESHPTPARPSKPRRLRTTLSRLKRRVHQSGSSPSGTARTEPVRSQVVNATPRRVLRMVTAMSALPNRAAEKARKEEQRHPRDAVAPRFAQRLDARTSPSAARRDIKPEDPVFPQQRRDSSCSRRY
jgi:hypothetical protein